MSTRAPISDAPPALDRLLDDLVRGGWLLGLAEGTDPVALRMDPETGAFAADHFEELVREAVTDAELQRAPRPGDGPSPGGVALISIRRLDLDPQRPLGPQMAILVDRLQLTLRLDDTVGRLSDDTIGVLLRGCPPEQLLAISRRCTGAVEDGDDGPVRVLVAAVHGTRDDARALIETILLSARPSTRSRSPA